MAINKLTYRSPTSVTPETWMDVTGDTVTSSTMLSGTRATGADGEKVTGNITSKTASDITVSGATVTVPAGHYASQATKSVVSGAAGTPTATKGTVSNHTISITPSVTNTTGYITGGDISGSPVTVSASELVSGTLTVTEPGITDVTNYASINVEIEGDISGPLDDMYFSDIDNIPISNTNVVPLSITQNGTYTAPSGVDGYNPITVNVSGGGGGVSATQHTIHLDFSDGTDTDIDIYYDDAFIGTMITAYTPTTYGANTVDLATLDDVIWYQRPTETWETVFNNSVEAISDTPYNYFWITGLTDVYPTEGSVWRITINNTEYRCTAYLNPMNGLPNIGNPLYSGGTDDGSGTPFNFYNAGWGAWVGDTELLSGATLTFKVERLVTE